MTNKRIEDLKELIEEKKKEIDNWEADTEQYEEQYCEALDEGGPVRIGSLEYTASYVLREVDPTAYRCGLNDYVDSLELEPEELKDELEALENELTELEDEIESLEGENKNE